jgi:hypothetical protein
MHHTLFRLLLTSISLVFLFGIKAWAEPVPTPVFENSFADMTYPSVAENYMVYNQRVGKSHQVMQVKKDDLYGAAKDVSAKHEQEVVKYGVALSSGDFAYVSNRTGRIIPWLHHDKQEIAIQAGQFTGYVLPNHLDVSKDGNTWVFDTTLEAARTPHIRKQFYDVKLPRELLGQSWRLYHERLWAKKSGYPSTKTGMSNAFAQPQLFTFKRHSHELTMLGDGFDASLSADGSWMVFVRESDGNFDLWMQHIDGTGLKRLTRSPFADVEPSLSPDGKKVVFISNRDSDGDVLQTFVYSLNLANQKITRLSFGQNVVDGGPAWLDNNTVIFHSNRDPKAPNRDTVDNWRLWTVALPK